MTTPSSTAHATLRHETRAQPLDPLDPLAPLDPLDPVDPVGDPRRRDGAGAVPDLFTGGGDLRLQNPAALPCCYVCIASLWTARGKELSASTTCQHLSQHFAERTVTSNISRARKWLSEMGSPLETNNSRSHPVFVPTSVPQVGAAEFSGPSVVCAPTMNFHNRLKHVGKALDVVDWMDLPGMIRHSLLDAMKDVWTHRDNFLAVWTLTEGGGTLASRNMMLYGALAYQRPHEVRDSNISGVGDGRKQRMKGWVLDYWNVDEDGNPTIMYGGKATGVSMRDAYARYVQEIECASWNHMLCVARERWGDDAEHSLVTRLTFLWVNTFPMMHYVAKSARRAMKTKMNKEKHRRENAKRPRVVTEYDIYSEGSIAVTATWDTSGGGDVLPVNSVPAHIVGGGAQLLIGDAVFSRAPVVPLP